MGKAHLALQQFSEVSWLNFGALGQGFVLLWWMRGRNFHAMPQFSVFSDFFTPWVLLENFLLICNLVGTENI